MRRLWLVALLLVAACSSSGGGKSATPTTTTTAAARVASGCSPARPHAAGTTTGTVRSSGIERSYRLLVPASYTGAAQVPIVFDWHGVGSTADEQLAYSNFGPLAEKDRFLVVAPEGQGSPRHFNLLPPPPGEGDEVVLADDLLAQLEHDLCIDTRRVFTTGMSNGGGMTALLACRDSQRFAAFASVALTFYVPLCDSARSVPMIHFHGTADPIVPFDGGTIGCCGNPQIGSAPKAIQQWADHDGCTTTPATSTPSPQVKLDQWSGCKDGAEVRLYAIQGGGHTWPGGIDIASLGMTTHEISATAVIWSFFATHPLPRR